jgi:hypothetical protein
MARIAVRVSGGSERQASITWASSGSSETGVAGVGRQPSVQPGIGPFPNSLLPLTFWDSRYRFRIWFPKGIGGSNPPSRTCNVLGSLNNQIECNHATDSADAHFGTGRANASIGADVANDPKTWDSSGSAGPDIRMEIRTP